MKRTQKTTAPSRNPALPRKSSVARPAARPDSSATSGYGYPSLWNGTERRRERIRLEEMGILAASIAHELRQPLSAIQNLAYYLKATLPPANETVRENLVLLEQQARLAGRILSNLVVFGRSGTPHRMSLPLDPILTEVLTRISWPSQIQLKLPLKGNRGQQMPCVFADPLHVDRILSNLITNGLESMEGAGTLSIAIRSEDRAKRSVGKVAKPGARSRPGDGRRQRFVVLEITDTGCGIEPERTGDIFDAFVTTKTNGTGLGLALCLSLAEANGGSISFRSQPGKGTTFELRLPAA